MSMVFRKLNSRRGASILLALVFFLISAMVGAVILTAASANVEKVRGRSEEQQAYLSIRSAAALLRDAMKDAKYTGTESKIIYACAKATDYTFPDHDQHADTYPDPTLVLDTAATDKDRLQAELGKMVDAVFRSTLRYTTPRPLDSAALKSSFTVTAEGMDPVYVQLKMDPGTYGITAALSVRDPADPDPEASAYAMTLKLLAGAEDVETPTVEDDVHRVSYYDMGEEKYKVVSRTFQKTTTVRTVTVTYLSGSVTKGVLTGD